MRNFEIVEASINPDVEQVFQPAGSGDFPVARWTAGWKARQNRPTTTPRL